MVAEPTTDDMRYAYAHTGLAFQGISFERAMRSKLFRMCLRQMVRCWQRQAVANGHPAPNQPALI